MAWQKFIYIADGNATCFHPQQRDLVMSREFAYSLSDLVVPLLGVHPKDSRFKAKDNFSGRIMPPPGNFTP